MEKELQVTKWCGKARYHFAEIDSTNKKAKELAEAGCAHGTLITADSQYSGVGRKGRSWSSETDAGIYMSVVLRPEIEPENAAQLTLIAAISVAKAMEQLLLIQDMKEVVPQIKWPNDIVLNKKKVCGILTEMSLNGRAIDYIVIGIGINVTNRIFPEDIKDTASSVLLETGIECEKESLIEAVWQQFEHYYEVFLQTEDLQSVKEEYESLLANKNKSVKVLDPLGEYEGVARGITKTGELLVETECEIKKVSGGEVSVRGIYGYV